MMDSSGDSSLHTLPTYIISLTYNREQASGKDSPHVTALSVISVWLFITEFVISPNKKKEEKKGISLHYNNKNEYIYDNYEKKNFMWS